MDVLLDYEISLSVSLDCNIRFISTSGLQCQEPEKDYISRQMRKPDKISNAIDIPKFPKSFISEIYI